MKIIEPYMDRLKHNMHYIGNRQYGGLFAVAVITFGVVLATNLALNNQDIRSYASDAIILTPVEDTTVKSAYPKKNYGNTTVLISSNADSNIQKSYLKFDLSQFAGKTISSASLILKPTVSRKIEKTVRLVTDPWTESGMNWNNKPAMTDVVGTIPLQKVVSGTPFSVALNPVIVQYFAGSELSLGIDNASSANVLKYYSSESSSANKPVLAITTADVSRGGPLVFEPVPEIPPFAANKLTPKVIILAWGDHPNPDVSETNQEIITRLERTLEWASMPGGWTTPPPADGKAQVDIQLPYGTNGIVQFAQDQPPKVDGVPDYVSILTNKTYPGLGGNSVCDLVNSNNLNEVWLLGYNSAGFSLSAMAGPVSSNETPENSKAFMTGNYPLITGTNCTKGVHVMGLSHEDVNETRPSTFTTTERHPSLDGQLTAFAQRFQSTFAHYLDNNQNYAYPPNWGPDPDGETDFIEFDRTFGYGSPPGLWSEPRSCGNALYPHNALWLGGREYYNKQNKNPGGSFDVTIKTDCTNVNGNWNMQHTGTVEELDCTAWDCWAELYLRRWMQHFPGYCNGMTKVDGSDMPNWWEMMYLNTVSPDSCVPTPTPTPGPTNTPAPTSTPTNTPTTTPTPAYKVFVTSTSYNGNLGGLSGADTKCQTRASAAGLSGIYKAWLSTNSIDAKSRILDTKYVRTDGLTVANSKADIIDGSLQNPIDITEFGTAVDDALTLTGTLPNGTRELDNNCTGWTTTSEFGNAGFNYMTNQYWTDTQSIACDYSGSKLYCFQTSQ